MANGVLAKVGEDWTEADRKKVATLILDEMECTANSNHLVKSNEVLDWSRRVRQVLTMPAGFLEENRESILHAFPFGKPE